MFALLAISPGEVAVLAGIGLPMALLGVAAALWLEARSCRAAAGTADAPQR
jgi:hypothetical protein